MRDTETGNSKGFAFINFASFEASDTALEAMNGQYLCNRSITCSYAFKKDTKGERHGTAAERLLAAQNPLFPSDRPHQIFSDIPGLRFLLLDNFLFKYLDQCLFHHQFHLTCCYLEQLD